MAISLGQEPSLLIAAGTNLTWGASEYGFSGWMRGAAYHWFDEFPATTQISEELLKETNAKWGRLIGDE